MHITSLLSGRRLTITLPVPCSPLLATAALGPVPDAERRLTLLEGLQDRCVSPLCVPVVLRHAHSGCFERLLASAATACTWSQSGSHSSGGETRGACGTGVLELHMSHSTL